MVAHNWRQADLCEFKASLVHNKFQNSQSYIIERTYLKQMNKNQNTRIEGLGEMAHLLSAYCC